MSTASMTRFRFVEEADWIVQQMFSPADLALSPEEYAACHAHEWGCFAYHLYRFRDPVLGAWVRRFGEILSSSEELERLRHTFLTAEERETIQKKIAAGF